MSLLVPLSFWPDKYNNKIKHNSKFIVNTNNSVFANLPIPKIHFWIIFYSWLSVLICLKHNTGDSSPICQYLIGPALSNSKVTKHVLSRFNSQTVFKWLRAGFWTWKIINLTSLISSILRLAPISLRMSGISWLLNRHVKLL